MKENERMKENIIWTICLFFIVILIKLLIAFKISFLSILLILITITVIIIKNKNKHNVDNSHKLTEDEEKVIKSEAQIYILYALAEKIKNKEIKNKVNDIIKISSDIIDNLKENHNNFKKAREYINYHQQTFNTIVNKYILISEYKIKDKNMEATLNKFEKLIIDFEEYLKNLLIYLYEEDTISLDVEMKVLETIIKE